ncbi:unnamed protein product [Didymodactylos carnosus]|uniref:C2 DOCK-type domain-containing protein n=1 Tax=Didymodactylos carnosus TaxID=1234261 RepID=A0A814M262_9BILA|nr:unnamed protein product [Didymodactylos carnosus]CAF1073457.1 unnamed protein product [Didymodactylos carnosus]CAF3563220.1 unnamed protein product [Didymodactylos carnosus]CAF3840324.1 unnamed protein product [Didymodactylos carnosus]
MNSLNDCHPSQKRKFVEKLPVVGRASEARKHVSFQFKQKHTQSVNDDYIPINYEEFLKENIETLNSDRYKTLVLFPPDDIQFHRIEHDYRTLIPTIPSYIHQQQQQLHSLVKQTLLTYSSSWTLIEFKLQQKYGQYFQQLPHHHPLPILNSQHKFEIDSLTQDENNEHLPTSSSPSASSKQLPVILKQGFLSLSSASRKSKRLYGQLCRASDSTFKLNFYKDTVKSVNDQPKQIIFLDSCSLIPKLNCPQSLVYTLSTENDQDLEEWYKVLLQTTHKQDQHGQGDSRSPIDENHSDTKQSQNGLSKIVETDDMIRFEREKDHIDLFYVYEQAYANPPPSLDDPMLEQDSLIHPTISDNESTKLRIHLQCEEFKSGLSLPSYANPEPFYLIFSLYDVKQHRKISENFYWNINERHSSETEDIPYFFTKNNIQNQLLNLNETLFSIKQPSDSIFLIVRVEKLLQGAISDQVEPYLISESNSEKQAQKIYQQTQKYKQKFGEKFLMPFAWGFKSLFKACTYPLEINHSSVRFYRQECLHLNDESIQKYLFDSMSNNKTIKLTPLSQMQLQIKLFQENRLPNNCLTTAYAPLKPFPLPLTCPLVIECQEFLTTDDSSVVDVFTEYIHHLYLYPKSLKYDQQKTFAKARNLCIQIELRDSDSENSKPLKCIYTEYNRETFFTHVYYTPVSHHCQTPQFYSEIKFNLPLVLTDQHHILFTFLHVSCDIKKIFNTVQEKELVVGYAWIPILKNGRLNNEECQLRVAQTLTSGYLKFEQLGLGKTLGPDIRWVDNGKLSRRPSLSNQLDISPVNKEMMDMDTNLKALHAVPRSTMIEYLPTLFNQLFKILLITRSQDVARTTMRVIVYIVSELSEANKQSALKAYIRYTYALSSMFSKTVHEELFLYLSQLLKPVCGDLSKDLAPCLDVVLTEKVLKYSWFFFEISIKSMALYVNDRSVLNGSRISRFPISYHESIEAYSDQLHLYMKSNETQRSLIKEIKLANKYFAIFIKKCLSLMDRGYIFRLIQRYLNEFKQNDSRDIYEMKFDFLRILCTHEHFIQLNLPLIFNYDRQGVDIHLEYQLSQSYRSNHFLTGLILAEILLNLRQVDLTTRDRRKLSISLLRYVLTKHEFDDRYKQKVLLSVFYFYFEIYNRDED